MECGDGGSANGPVWVDVGTAGPIESLELATELVVGAVGIGPASNVGPSESLESACCSAWVGWPD